MEHFRSSVVFKATWAKFIAESLQVDPCPILYQFIVDCVFNALIKRHFHVEPSERQSQEVTLDYEGKNALRYTAGYVTMALVNKLKRSAHPMKEEVVCCLIEMNDEEIGDAKDDSEDWTATTNRGGLQHVSNMT